jgi:hypothetical protein
LRCHVHWTPPSPMKAPNQTEQLKSMLSSLPRLFSTVLAMALCWGLPAAGQQSSAQSTTTSATQTDPGLATNQLPAMSLSRGVAEILKMADAGVSSEVIKAYVECSPTPYQPTDVDVIALKKHNVTDEVVTILLKRGAQVRAALVQARNDALARALASRRMASGGLDPESYEYFQHYYLQPRALASAYERLAPYSYAPFPYSYGYPSGPPFSGGPAYPYGPGAR